MKKSKGKRDKLTESINDLFKRNEKGKHVLKQDSPVWEESHKHSETTFNAKKKDGVDTTYISLYT